MNRTTPFMLASFARAILHIWNDLRGNAVYPINTEEKSTYATISKCKTFPLPSNDRTTTVILGKLEPDENAQPDLFEDNIRVEKLSRVSKTVDAINDRFGKHTVSFASSLFLRRQAAVRGSRAERPIRKTTLLTRIFHVFYVKYPPRRLRRACRNVLAQDYPFGASKGYLEQGVFYAAPKLWLQVVVAKAYISHVAAAREICGLTYCFLFFDFRNTV